MKKIINKNTIFSFILGIILCSGIVYASGIYSAKDISYNNENSEVTNVNDALDEIKIELENSSKLWNNMELFLLMYANQSSQINTSGYKTLTISNGSTGLPVTLIADNGTVLSTTTAKGEVIDVSNYDYVTARFSTDNTSWWGHLLYTLNY